jgi:hypothetical protein
MTLIATVMTDVLHLLLLHITLFRHLLSRFPYSSLQPLDSLSAAYSTLLLYPIFCYMLLLSFFILPLLSLRHYSCPLHPPPSCFFSAFAYSLFAPFSAASIILFFPCFLSLFSLPSLDVLFFYFPIKRCATSRKVAGFSPDEVIEFFFNLRNPSSSNMALGFTQTLI